MAEKFWILWCPTSNLPPTVKFSSEKQAEEAAVTMVRKHHAEFIVMESRHGYADGKPRRVPYSAKPKKVGPPVAARKVEYIKPYLDTYSGWQNRGRQVQAGEHAVKRGPNGEAFFSWRQTEKLGK